MRCCPSSMLRLQLSPDAEAEMIRKVVTDKMTQMEHHIIVVIEL